MSPTGETTPQSEEKNQKYLNEKQQDLLMMCISQDLGFDSWKPVAAFVIYKCLLHRRSFEVERTSAFDWIIPIVASVIAVHDSIDALAYWLSNISTLLTLLQHTLKASEAVSSTRTRRRSSAASLIGRISQSQSAGLPFSTRQKLGKYPALLFKMELTAFLEKIYRMIRDSLKKEISPVVGLCIQAPRKSHQGLGILVRGRTQANDDVLWLNIVKSLNNYLKIIKAKYLL